MTDKMREQFEKWLSLKYGSHMVSKWDPSSRTYNQLACTIAFESWKESRAAIEIFLPEKHEADYNGATYQDDNGDLYRVDDVVRSILDQGLKVKP